jgi:predicted negative regulator of RcsB-dependent stress response
MTKKIEEKEINVGQTLSKTEDFFEENKKGVSVVLVVLLVAIGGYFGYTKLIVGPKEKDAQAQMFVAERYFEMDSLRLAIHGDGNYYGFEKIVDEYGMTPSGALAKYYLGLCYLRTGEYEKSVKMLNSFSSDDEMLNPLAAGAIGDAYAQMGKMDEAASQYKKAASLKENNFTSPVLLMKAGMAFEETGKPKEALAMYEKIKKDFSESTEGRDIEKYIARAKAGVN